MVNCRTDGKTKFGQLDYIYCFVVYLGQQFHPDETRLKGFICCSGSFIENYFFSSFFNTSFH